MTCEWSGRVFWNLAFTEREDRDAVFQVKNRLKSSARHGEAYITQDFARAIQNRKKAVRKTFIKSTFAAEHAGHDARVVNVPVDNNVSNIPVGYQVAPN